MTTQSTVLPNKLTLQKIISVVTDSFETLTVHSHPTHTVNLLTTDLTVLNLGSRLLLAVFQSRQTASVTHWLGEHLAHIGKRNVLSNDGKSTQIRAAAQA